LLIETNEYIEKSIKYLKSYIYFRLDYESNWQIDKFSILELIQSKIAFRHKHDKFNTPRLIVKVKNFIAADHITKDFFRFFFL
jgi:hypothetical protein